VEFARGNNPLYDYGSYLAVLAFELKASCFASWVLYHLCHTAELFTHVMDSSCIHTGAMGKLGIAVFKPRGHMNQCLEVPTRGLLWHSGIFYVMLDYHSIVITQWDLNF
jgi:hypothetical protein